MHTTGAVVDNDNGCRTMKLCIRQPGGEIHTLLPRPRPASCVVAVNTRPVGNVRRIDGFLRDI